MRHAILLGLLMAVAVQPVTAQTNEANGTIPIYVLIADVEGPAQFTTGQVRAVVVGFLASKFPDFAVSESLSDPLWLVVKAICFAVPQSQGETCELNAAMFLNVAWKSPFGDLQNIYLWENAAVLTGPPGTALGQITTFLDENLDVPASAWNELDDDGRACWTGFLKEALDYPEWQG